MTDADRRYMTPKERLALSRKAIVRQLNGDDRPEDDPGGRYRSDALEDSPDMHGLDGAALGDGRSSGGHRRWTSMARSMTERWWRRHPAHAMGQLARPVLEHYARKEPAKLMAIAAATGAALVLLKPWRLLSATAVLAAVLKTSDVADIVNTLMQKNASPRKDPR